MSGGDARDEVNYPSYLSLDRLLSLQQGRAEPEHPDELLFIVVHQASELWFKVLLRDIDGLIAAFEGGNAGLANWHVRRLNTIMRIVSSQLSSLDALPPQHFAQFRQYLGTSSGSQSVQFRTLEAASGLRDSHFMHALAEHGDMPEPIRRALARPTLHDLFLGLVKREGVTLQEIYTGPGPSMLFFLAEGLLEYEQQFAEWRFKHVMLVERILGPDTGGTGGTLGAKYLSRTVSQRFFPELWAVRAQFYGTWDRHGDLAADTPHNAISPAHTTPPYICPMPAPIYLDHSATTPVRSEVLEAMQPYYGPRFGNPSSIHRWGREARVALDEARERVARCLGANPDEICFTSGGTEADNLAILGAWRSARARGRTAVVATPIEHKAVLEAVHTAGHEGAEERLIEMTPDGVADAASFDRLVRPDVAIASVMWVNNEMGAIQPVPQFAAIAHERGVLFHTDAVQAFSKVDIDASKVPFHILTISGHKIGAPKGIGALFIRRGTAIEPLFHGGTQDRGRRPGTENVAFAVGLATAAELALAGHEAESTRLAALRDRLQAMLVARVPDIVVHARHAPRAPHILNVSVPGTESESLLMALDLQGIACSGGSACQSGTNSPSYVLSAIGVKPSLAGAAIRMSLGVLTDDAAIDRVAEVFPRLAAKARGVAVGAA